MLKERIRHLRQKKGLSQAALGELLNLSQQAVAKWETDKAEPDTDNLIKLSQIFDVDVNYLLGITDDPTPPGKPKKELTLEEQILNNPDLSEEAKKIMLQQLGLVKILDNMKTKNELAKEKLQAELGIELTPKLN